MTAMARSAEEIAARIVRGSVVPHLRTMVGEVELGRTVRSITRRVAAAITAARAEAWAEARRQAADDIDEWADLHATEGGTSAEVASIRWSAEQLRAHFTEPKGKG